MTWLVIGGAGYIGSHLVHLWANRNVPVVVLDDLSTGRLASLPQGVPVVHADARDSARVERALSEFAIRGIVHLAARKHARESVQEPLAYWRTNLGALMNVLEAAEGRNVRRFLLSSSCSVYGSAGEVTTSTALNPQSPYGRTKVMSEALLKDWTRTSGGTWAALRYFNVIGNAEFPNAPDRSSECLVPAASREIRAGERPMIFGADFPTPDGTAMRDYLDVRDIATAHAVVAADLESAALTHGQVLNVSTGSPTSVRTILDVITKETNWSGTPDVSARRTGDPERIWAQPSPELHALGWTPTFSIQESIHAHVHHPDSVRKSDL
jgi:UDP-glucose 4-epimerase